MAVTLISHTTVGVGGTSSINLSSIPGTYDDLLVIMSLRTASTGGLTTDDVLLQYNGSTSGYSHIALTAEGSPISPNAELGSGRGSHRAAKINTSHVNNPANSFSVVQLYIPAYANTTLQTQATSESYQPTMTSTTAAIRLTSGRHTPTGAITSILIMNDSGTNFVQHSTVSLYGITKA